MIECSSAAACEQIAAAQIHIVGELIPATMLVALVLVLLHLAAGDTDG